MVRIIIATIVGAVLLFVWGMISWTVLPWHDWTMDRLPDEEKVIKVLSAMVEQDGLYMFPAMPERAQWKGPGMDAWKARHEAGPVGMLLYQAKGAEPMPPITYVRSFVLNLMMVLVAAVMLYMAAPTLTRYWERLVFVFLFGVLAALGFAMDLNWFGHPADWTMVMAADQLVSWLLLGVVVGAIVKRKAQTAPAAV